MPLVAPEEEEELYSGRVLGKESGNGSLSLGKQQHTYSDEPSFSGLFENTNDYDDAITHSGSGDAYFSRAHVTYLQQVSRPIASTSRERSEAWPSKTQPHTCLVADISGFTSAERKLAVKGRAGCDAFAAQLDASLSSLVECVYDAGGDLVEFAGDAVIALWPEKDKHVAVEAATAMLRALERVSHRNAESERFQLHAGVAVGDVMMVALDARQENGNCSFVTYGPAVDAAGKLSEEANKGEVKVEGGRTITVADALAMAPAEPSSSPDAAAPPAPTDDTTPRDTPSPALVSLHLAVVQRPKRDRLKAIQQNEHSSSSIDFVSELRTIASIFARLPTLSQHAREGHLDVDMLQRTYVHISNAVARHEGTINQVLFDDKGFVFKVVFGLTSVATQRITCTRAVLCAIAMQDALRKDNLPPASIGVATGTAFFGICGPSVRRELVMLGAGSVTLAARLMQKADGVAALCSPEVHEETRRDVDYGDELEMNFKGIDIPMKIYVPVRRAAILMKSRSRKDDGLPLRVALQERLTSIVEGVCGERVKAEAEALPIAKTALIEAPSGMGKTMAMSHVDAVARRMGVRVFHIAAHSVLPNSTFPIVRSIILQLTGLRSTLDNVAMHDAIAALQIDEQAVKALARNLSIHQAATETHSQQHLSKLSSIQEENEGTDELLRRANAPGSAELLISALCTLLSSQAPLVLCIDNAQWLTSSEWLCLQTIHQKCERVCIAMASSLVADGLGWNWHSACCGRLKAQERVETMELGVLVPDDVHTLLKHILGGEVAPSLLDFVLGHTGGVPLFIETAVKWMLEEGLVHASTNVSTMSRDILADVSASENSHSLIADRKLLYWTLSKTELDGAQASLLPESVEAAMLSRINHLPVEVMDVAKTAACFPRQFSAADVVEVMSADSAESLKECQAALEQLVERGFIVPINARTSGSMGILSMVSDRRASGDEFMHGAGDDDVLVEKFTFAHAISRQAIDAMMTDAQKTAVHVRLAKRCLRRYQILKVRGDSDINALAGDVAHHLEASGNLALACDHYEEAARAVMGDDNLLAIKRFESALRLADAAKVPDQTKGKWHVVIARSHIKDMNVIDAWPHCVLASNLLGEPILKKTTSRTSAQSKSWEWMCCIGSGSGSGRGGFHSFAHSFSHMNRVALVAIASALNCAAFCLATQASNISTLLPSGIDSSKLTSTVIMRSVAIADAVDRHLANESSGMLLREAVGPMAVMAGRGMPHRSKRAFELLSRVNKRDLDFRQGEQSNGRRNQHPWALTSQQYQESIELRFGVSLGEENDDSQLRRSFSAARKSASSRKLKRVSTFANHYASSGLELEAFLHSWWHWYSWWQGLHMLNLTHSQIARTLFATLGNVALTSRAQQWVVTSFVELARLDDAEEALLELRDIYQPNAPPQATAMRQLVDIEYAESLIAAHRRDASRLATSVGTYASVRAQFPNLRPPVLVSLWFELARGLSSHFASTEISMHTSHSATPLTPGGLLTASVSLAKALDIMRNTSAEELLRFISPECLHAAVTLICAIRKVGRDRLPPGAVDLVRSLILQWRSNQPGIARARAAVLLHRLDRNSARSYVGLLAGAAHVRHERYEGSLEVDKLLVHSELRGASVQKYATRLKELGLTWFYEEVVSGVL